MTTDVAVIDYGVGNMLNVVRACEHLGATVSVVETAGEVAGAQRVILPGVGAFFEGMSGLRERGLVSAIRDYVAQNRPFLGICLGMQLMFDESDEFGHHAGLSLMPGRVTKLPNQSAQGEPLRVPHIGWKTLEPSENTWADTVAEDLDASASMYFVHSYHVLPKDERMILATSGFGGQPIVAIVRHGNVYGCQFHPEKSGARGLGVLNRFLGNGLYKPNELA